MKPAAFEYFAPSNVEEALTILTAYGADAKVLAGGQSLVPLMNFRLARPSCLVDINGIAALSGIQWCNGRLQVGATTRQSDTARDASAIANVPVLVEAIGFIGHLAIRNLGTVGGSIAHADPAAELPVLALALDAEMCLRNATGTRSVSAEDFFTGYLSTVIHHHELLTSVAFCVPPKASGWCFTEIARRHGDFALVAVATVLTLDSARTIADVRIALGGVGPTPVRARTIEHMLIGQSPGDDVFRAAAATIDDALDPPDDIHASADYRRHLAAVLVRRALETARARHA